MKACVNGPRQSFTTLELSMDSLEIDYLFLSISGGNYKRMRVGETLTFVIMGMQGAHKWPRAQDMRLAHRAQEVLMDVRCYPIL